MSIPKVHPIGLDTLAEVWVYLSATPLFGLTLTLLAYVVADTIYQRSNKFPLANPVLIAVALIVALLAATGTRYETYFQGAQFVHFLLGTATVALAVPLARLWRELASRALPLLTAMFAGATVSVLVAIGVAKLLAAPPTIVAALMPKSVTAPIAMGIAEQIGGSPTLAAVFAISTGIFGALIATPLLNALGIRDWSQRGFAVGVAAHGIGTARAYSVDPRRGLRQPWHGATCIAGRVGIAVGGATHLVADQALNCLTILVPPRHVNAMLHEDDRGEGLDIGRMLLVSLLELVYLPSRLGVTEFSPAPASVMGAGSSRTTGAHRCRAGDRSGRGRPPYA